MSRAYHCSDTSAADAQGYTGTGTLMGAVVRETGTGAGTILFRDGTSTAGPIIATMNVAQSGTVSFLVPAVQFDTGIFLDRAGTGVTDVTLYLF